MEGCTHWIFDGYNVMHALKKIPKELSFELAREHFIAWLSPFAADGKQVTVVFDAHLPSGTPDGVHRIRVLFSTPGVNADGLILNLVRQAARSHSSLTVVTNDLLLRDTLFNYPCCVISAESFLNEWRQVSSASHPSTSPKAKRFYRPFKDL